MTIRHSLPLFALTLLGACASNVNSSDVGSESSATIEQAVEAQDDFDRDRGDHERHEAEVRHVVLISVDGLHEVDLAKFVAEHPDSTFGKLARSGIQYTDAHAPTPTDSFPG